MISVTPVLFFQILTDCKQIANNHQKLLTNQFFISMITSKQILGTARGGEAEDVGSSSLFTPTI